ncbi:CAP domain-containing protein [Bacillaceae bacterium W0354]
MFKLLKYLIMIVIIGLILNILPSSLITSNQISDEQNQIHSIVGNVKGHLAEIDYEELKEDVINGWKNLYFIVNRVMKNDEVTTTFAPVSSRVDGIEETEVVANNDFEAHKFELKVLELVNVERDKHGLAPLEYSKEVSIVARDKSWDMANNGYFNHESPTYGSPFEMMDAYGVDYWAAGENIAKGHRSPEQVMEGWMNSEGHRANILQENFTHLGVGFVKKGGTYYWTQMFIGK